MNSATDLTVANTIHSQIGGRMAFAMMGAKNVLGGENSLQWKLGRNPTRITHVTVTLDPSDTYTVKFSRVARNYSVSTVSEFDGVYADSLKQIIEQETKLYLSL